jgi:hypothetical protein
MYAAYAGERSLGLVYVYGVPSLSACFTLQDARNGGNKLYAAVQNKLQVESVTKMELLTTREPDGRLPHHVEMDIQYAAVKDEALVEGLSMRLQNV